MTGQIGQVPGGGANPSPVQGQPQRPALDNAILNELKSKGIDPNDASQMTPLNLQSKGVSAATIATIFPSQQSTPAAGIGIQAGTQLAGNPPTSTFTATNPTASQVQANEPRRANERYRHQTNVQFATAAKEYARLEAEFAAKQAEVNELRAKYNDLMKKTMKSTVTVDGQKVDKEQARAAAQAALKQAIDELGAIRTQRDTLQRQLEGNNQLSAANRYNMENAGDDAARRQAAVTDTRDYLQSAEGRAAVEDNLVHTEDGTALLSDAGRAHRRGSTERAAAYDAIQAEYAESGHAVSRRGARRIYKSRVRNYQLMQKEDALQKIIVGDKAAYKAQRQDDENGNPTVTYMSEDLYKKAQQFARARGIELPSLEDARTNGLTGDQLRQFQQLLMDEAGDVGSRLDAKERKALHKEFRDISYKDFRQMFEAGNVDVQRTYSTAAEVAGAVAGATTAVATGLYDAGEAGYSLGLSGLTGGTGAGSSIVDQGSDWVPGTAGKFNWGNAALSVAVDRAVAEGIKAVANYDPNGFHKGVTLEQYVYNELDKDEAFKKLAPNVKATMAKIIAENSKLPEDQRMTKDQIFAACARALGDANGRINLRESVGADAATRALRNRERPDIPQDEIIPALDGAEVWDVNGDGFMDMYGQAVSIGNATIVDNNNQVTADAVTQNQADGLAYDQRVVNRDKRNTPNAGTFDQVRDRSNVDAEGTGRLTSQNKITHRSQYIIADEKGETHVNIGSGTVHAPDELTFKDNTNGVTNEYKYKKLSDSEAKAKGLNPGDGPFYELLSATDSNGKDITKTKGKVFKLHFSSTARKAYGTTEDSEGYTTGRTSYTVLTPHYDLEAVTNLGQSSPYYNRTGARPN